jgi:hypothetical protein
MTEHKFVTNYSSPYWTKCSVCKAEYFNLDHDKEKQQWIYFYKTIENGKTFRHNTNVSKDCDEAVKHIALKLAERGWLDIQ